ncbi:MAG: hypothetical protein RMM53_06260 [Bacteroidia bacterium]|nr:hypothetical protein [Bacteroidia bacterium]
MRREFGAVIRSTPHFARPEENLILLCRRILWHNPPPGPKALMRLANAFGVCYEQTHDERYVHLRRKAILLAKKSVEKYG